ncbi:HAMP domain-containing protein [Oculatella sp. LEGE 06141]|uniref:ATP-binding protein n=1 Tax=Oculatella sp. LEGE 06141 TaxID=1828648 RepID=UPI0018813E20|nr:ATP-binding protein [Oculatella sp. LEGE 06141]MBE9181976.1 HAMP domain-containing protein [Oculatella sp. LEGE 06141]
MVNLRNWRHSFRLRIALLSAALAGGALIGFGAASWWLIYDAKVSRLDATLENQLMRTARPRSQEPDRWQFLEDSLARDFETNEAAPIALWIVRADGHTLYRSDDWPTDLNLGLSWRSPGYDSSSWRPSPPDASSPDADLPPGRTRTPSLEHSSNHSSLRPERPSMRPPPKPRIVTHRATTGAWRVGITAFPSTTVAIAVSLHAVDQEMMVIRNVFLIAIPGILLLIAGGAWKLSGSALQPIHQLTNVIQNVTAQGLDQRIPVTEIDVEFVGLIQVFNQMLERLERSFKQASRFSGDAAHELKTPLTILQGELERTLQQVEPGSEIQQNLGNLLDEVRRLSEIVRKLLLLSLSDAGQMSLYRVQVNVSEILVEIAEDMELLAPDLTVTTDIAAGLQVQGDRDLLTQVLQNLISNAIKYNLPNGWIQIHAHLQEAVIIVTISNASSPIPAADRDRIFDRFHRGDPARTRKIEGIGLGLSLAREIVRAHQGTLTLDRSPSAQTAFTLRLPASV